MGQNTDGDNKRFLTPAPNAQVYGGYEGNAQRGVCDH